MDDYLGRESASFSEAFWGELDEAVVSVMRETLVARRFIPLYGPLGPGVQVAPIDSPVREETVEGGFAVAGKRRFLEVPQLCEDFWLLWRDLEASERERVPTDLSAARIAAQTLANREDEMVFYGVKKLGVTGLLTTPGVNSLHRGDWNEGETAFTDIVAGLTTLRQKGRVGRHSLALSLDLYAQLHRIQPGTGILELDRVKQLVDGRLFPATVLEPGTALIVCAQPQYVDLLVGQDIRTAYLELADLNHHFRILETALPRIKFPDAIVIYRN